MTDIQLKKPYSKIFNRVRVKYEKDETTTSYYEKRETWNWGDSTSSFLYGVRTYNVENEFLDITTAETIADNIYTQYKDLKKEIHLNSKYVPHLGLNYNVTLTHKTKIVEGDDQWYRFNWGEGIWGNRLGYNINIENEEFRIISLEHNIDRIYTKVVLREI
jgi:hypothetical protein